MLRPMFGMGMTEILVILVVAMLFLGPEKLPEAAKSISKGIRDLRKQTREFTDTIENDTEIGGAIRDIKSALRGDEIRRPPVRKVPPAAATPAVAAAATTEALTAGAPVIDLAAAKAAAAVAPPGAPTTDDDAVAAAEDPLVADDHAAHDVAARDDDSPAGDAPADGAAEAPADDDLASLVRPATGAIGRGQAS